MSQNEILHLEANFGDWKAKRAPGLKGVEPFLYYTIEQVLKPYNLEDVDIRYGITDHPNDGGIDAIYFIANRNTLVRDDLDIATSGTRNVRLLIMQAKSSLTETGFNAEDVEKFTRFTDDLLSLSRPASSFAHKYQPHLLTIMHNFKEKYSQIAGNFPDVKIDYYYITRGDETTIEPVTQDSVDKLNRTVKQFFPDATVLFKPINTQRLLEYAKMRRPKNRTLKWAEHPPMSIQDGFIGLVKLPDYATFLKDSDGELNELMFESNVRGYQKNTPVNKQIRNTLNNPDTVEFWLLNNGITIVSGGQTAPTGSMHLAVEDPQVVNGLQTSREIFRYYQEQTKAGNIRELENRSVLVKVIRVADDVTRDAIIKATNSQNPMSSASLRATDAIHHQIEALFNQFGLFYDRRRGFYKDQGRPIADIISVTELVQAIVSTILQRPDDARARPGDYLRKDKEYARLFKKDAVPISAYYKAVQIVRRIDEFLDSRDVGNGDQRNIKFYIAYYLVCELSKRLNPTAEDVLRIELDSITDSVLEQFYAAVWSDYTDRGWIDGPDVLVKGPMLLAELKKDLSTRYTEEASTRSGKGKKRTRVRDTIAASGLRDAQPKA